MRILMLTQFYPPILGGIEQHVRNLSIELVRRGHDVAVATMLHAGQPPFEEEQGVRIYRIRSSVQRLPWLFSESGRQYPPPCPDPEIMLELRKVLIKERPQIVHAHNWLVRSFLPLKAWSRASLVMTLHNYSLTCAKVNYIYNEAACEGPVIVKCFDCVVKHYGFVRGTPTILANWIMDVPGRQAVDMFLPVSQAVATGNMLAHHDLPFHIIPNFIADLPSMASENTDPYTARLPAGDFLLFVGALAHVKGVETLLRAYAGLTNPLPLVLIGYQTPDWDRLVSYCSPNVLVYKDWPHHAVMAAWSRCSLALIPSIFPDPCPTVAMEAMSMGKPIIAARSGGLSDIVTDGETGLLVPPGDIQALRDAIEALVNDPVRRAHMGMMAKQCVPQFQAQSVVTRVEEIYNAIIQKSPALAAL